MPSLTTLEFTCDHGVAHITLNRPDAANGLDMTMSGQGPGEADAGILAA